MEDREGNVENGLDGLRNSLLPNEFLSDRVMCCKGIRSRVIRRETVTNPSGNTIEGLAFVVNSNAESSQGVICGPKE
jgi:hypothetical protein